VWISPSYALQGRWHILQVYLLTNLSTTYDVNFLFILSPYLFGQTTDSSVQLGQNIIGNRANGEQLRDAAFYYLVTGNADYRSKVLTELLSQASEGGWDFTNTARWCIQYPGGLQGDGAPTFEVTMWLNKLLFGYDYLLAGDRVYGQLLSAADKTKLDNRFLNAGLFWEKETRVILENRFANRGPGDWLSGDYSPPWGSAGGNCVNTYYGSPLKRDFQEAWQNRGAAKARFWGLVGVMMNNTLLKNQAKRYFREWLGIFGPSHRCDGDSCRCFCTQR
jgi:hypothetical protein